MFLKWVASFAHMDSETGNLMDLPNLATVIAPSIMRSRGRDPMRDETFGALRIVTNFLENQDEFFLVPVDLLPVLQDHEHFANSMELPGKEFLKKCETYMKAKGMSGRPLPSNGQYNGPVNGAPRYHPAMTSPTSDRPPPNATFTSDPRNIRQHQPPHSMQTGMPHQTYDGHVSPSSPSLPQGMMQNTQRAPPMDEWHPPPRLRDPNALSSRPPSFSDSPRPSFDHTQGPS